MVKLNCIYTKTGDGGKTGLGNGLRVEKTSLRITAMGDVDEANAAIGVARLHTIGQLDGYLAAIQNDLFDLGADIAVPDDGAISDGVQPSEKLRIIPAQVERLEAEIDVMNETLAPLTSFILPGGSEAAARLHLARTIVRRAERALFALAKEEPVGPDGLHYLNRLSDHLFVAARWANDKGRADVLWQPGATR